MISLSQAARDHGINENVLRRWAKRAELNQSCRNGSWEYVATAQEWKQVVMDNQVQAMGGKK